MKTKPARQAEEAAHLANKRRAEENARMARERYAASLAEQPDMLDDLKFLRKLGKDHLGSLTALRNQGRLSQTNTKSASGRRTQWTALLARCRDGLLKKGIKPDLRSMLTELEAALPITGNISGNGLDSKRILHAVDRNNHEVRCQYKNRKELVAHSFSSISTWLSENKPK